MFSLIITIISIALVAVLALATLYYGGDAFNKGTADAQAAKAVNQGQQLLGAAELFFLDNRRWPNDVAELVSTGYLKAAPVAARATVGQALAAEPVETWAAVGEAVNWFPVYHATISSMETCRAINKRAVGIDGILAQPRSNHITQCYGTAATGYVVVVGRDGQSLTDAYAADTAAGTTVVAGSMADATDWEVAPTVTTGGGTPAPAPGTTEDPTGVLTVIAAEMGALPGWVSFYNTDPSGSVRNVSLRNDGASSVFLLPMDPQVAFGPTGTEFSYLPGGCVGELVAGASCTASIRTETPGPEADSTFLVPTSAGDVPVHVMRVLYPD